MNVANAPGTATPLHPVPTLAALYAAHADWVVQTLGRLGVAERDRDDLAHDVFVVVHRKRLDLDPQRPVRPWLFGIAFRVVSGFRRRARNRYEVPMGTTVAQDPQGIEGQMSARQQLARVEKALSAINYERRAVFVMHELDGFSIPEIATVIESPLNTLYSHLRRARKEFRDAFESSQGGNGDE